MSSPRYRILIIDDDSLIVNMYTLKFKAEHDFEVETANDGKTGLKKIDEYKPDLVLLDVVMPQMDGFEVLQAILKEHGTLPTKIVFLTNLGQREEIERGKKLGVTDYIIKAHLTPSEVVERVRKLVKT